jgi:hypothetical protein
VPAAAEHLGSSCSTAAVVAAICLYIALHQPNRPVGYLHVCCFPALRLQCLVSAEARSYFDEQSFAMISTASFEPTVVLPANTSSAAKLQQDAAFSTYAQVRPKWLCYSRVAVLSSEVLLSYMSII